MRRWQVVTVLGVDDRPHRWARAWTEAGAWRKARRLHRPTSWIGQHFACADRLATGCADSECTLTGWFEVRPAADNRTMLETLDDEMANL